MQGSLSPRQKRFHNMHANCACDLCTGNPEAALKIPASNYGLWTAARHGMTSRLQHIFNRRGYSDDLVFDDSGQSLLHAAVLGNHVETVNFLLSMGMHADANRNGATPLHRACSWGRVKVASVLIQAGADLNAIDTSFGDLRTPLHKVAENNTTRHAEICSLLLQSGCRTDVLDLRGMRALEVSASSGSDKVLDCLLHYDSNVCRDGVVNLCKLVGCGGHIDALLVLRKRLSNWREGVVAALEAAVEAGKTGLVVWLAGEALAKESDVVAAKQRESEIASLALQERLRENEQFGREYVQLVSKKQTKAKSANIGEAGKTKASQTQNRTAGKISILGVGTRRHLASMAKGLP